ncbi:hypothetical protein [Pseudoalteromonas byunsanensis]|uniref:Uncharacterized protein n=1 Tax=Pseudoalteromonas byunsanensis TaxID=327939 RepID=A0A1S1N6F7_9GAMM|nr:hypothetical protein [Pseudoalteromonas byunsanensis]OHU96812.1 hypothetical protein BIW53_05685 [Pseudoalteromonas byunsanensis]
MIVKHSGTVVATFGNVLNRQQVGEYLYVNEIDLPTDELEIVLEYEEVIAARKHAYQSESDPLFIEWQYDQTDEAKQIWMDKVAEIKTRYPLPV